MTRLLAIFYPHFYQIKFRIIVINPKIFTTSLIMTFTVYILIVSKVVLRVFTSISQSQYCKDSLEIICIRYFISIDQCILWIFLPTPSIMIRRNFSSGMHKLRIFVMSQRAFIKSHKSKTISASKTINGSKNVRVKFFKVSCKISRDYHVIKKISDLLILYVPFGYISIVELKTNKIYNCK